jgi:hypothetical protein
MMGEEPKCPNCGAEVDIGQKMCAWCGADLPKVAPPPPTHAGRTDRNGPSPSTGSVLSIEEARNLARSGNLEGALSAFEEILTKDSHHQEALFGMGGVHFKKGDKRKAAEAWLKLRRINPAYPHIDSWVSQVQDAIPQPTQAAPRQPQAQPVTLSPTPAPPSTYSRRATQPPRLDVDHGMKSHEGDDDWTKQSVRIDTSKASAVKEVVSEPSPQRYEPVPEFKPNPIPIWVTPLSWILVIGYAVLFVGVYFLTK